MILCEPGPGVRPLRLAKRLRGGERRPAAPALTHCWQATRQVQVRNDERRELERLGHRHATDLAGSGRRATKSRCACSISHCDSIRVASSVRQSFSSKGEKCQAHGAQPTSRRPLRISSQRSQPTPRRPQPDLSSRASPARRPCK